MSTIRTSFTMQGNRVDLSQAGDRDRRILASQVNHILDETDKLQLSSGRHVAQDGNHLTVDQQDGATLSHQETWFQPKLPLSIAENPGEAMDRTFLHDWKLTPDPASHEIRVERSETDWNGIPNSSDWQFADAAPAPKHGFFSRLGF